MSAILKTVGTIVMSASAEKLVAKTKFGRGEVKARPNCPRKNFNIWFFAGDGKVEEPQDEQTLCYHELCQPCCNSSIIDELGGEAKAETTLTVMSSLMKMQENRERGVLLTNAMANIFYVRDVAGTLRTVYVSWIDGSWRIGAMTTHSSFKWSHRGFGNCRVFSRQVHSKA
ncbi:MAG: hypothetical protein AAB534_03040 [Patescibacteria group bacterium]